MIIHTFHGSLNKSINEFHIATHFGSRDQALSAIGAKFFLDEIKQGTPTLYKVKIDVPDSKLFKAEKDWGKSGPHGALLAIRKRLEKNSTEEELTAIAKRFYTHQKSIINKSCSAEEILLSESNGRYAVIEYNNEVESIGSGFCVIDPSLIMITTVTQPTWNEVIEAFKYHQDCEKAKQAVEIFLNTL
jgi:hypothetical protein